MEGQSLGPRGGPCSKLLAPLQLQLILIVHGRQLLGTRPSFTSSPPLLHVKL